MSGPDEGSAVPPYPIGCDVEPQLTDRNRVTTGFRLILAVPQMIIIGGFSVFAFEVSDLRDSGALAAAAFAMAFIAWFAIVFTGKHPRGLWDFAVFYVRWWIRVSAYLTLLRDEYPPFGEGPYAMDYRIGFPEPDRNRWSVGFRLILVIPQAIVLFFVNLGWLVTTVIAWFAILFTGAYPEGLYRFGVGALRWNVRVHSYVLLLRDEYPPFRLTP